MKLVFRSIATTVAAALVVTSVPMQAQAGLVSTQQAVHAELMRIDRATLAQMFDRDDVRAQLQSMGVDANVARERVATLTDDEVAQIQGRMQELPVGGDDVLGILFTVFIILLITDILGFTKVFPFTRPIR